MRPAFVPYKEWSQKHKAFIKKCDKVQKELIVLCKEAEAIGKKEKIFVTLLPRTVNPTDKMQILLARKRSSYGLRLTSAAVHRASQADRR